VGGTSDGRVTSVSALVGARPSDYLTRKRAAERANHEARQRDAGTYVSADDAMARTLARANDYWGLSPLRQQVIPVIVDVRKRMATLIADLSNYTMADHGALSEVAVHLGHLSSALKDLDREHAARKAIPAKTEAAAVKLTADLTSFIERRPSHAV